MKHRTKTRTCTTDETDEFKPLISFQESDLTGRKLYEQANKDGIVKLAESGPSPIAAANYQSALKQLWNSLTDGERTDWERKAGIAEVGRNEGSYDSEHVMKYVHITSITPALI